MRKAPILILVLAAVIAVAGIFGYALGSEKSSHDTLVQEESNITPVPDFTSAFPYLGARPDECGESDVSSNFMCLIEKKHELEVNISELEKKLISEASTRLAQTIESTATDSPSTWKFGGERSLKDLPDAVRGVKEATGRYIEAFCNLDAMYVYGSSGWDAELLSCEYHYEIQYYSVLKKLKLGLATSSQAE